MALLGKWRWRLMHEQTGLWIKLYIDVRDNWKWKGEQEWHYIVKFAYEIINKKERDNTSSFHSIESDT